MNILNNEKNFKALIAFGVSASIDKFIYKSPLLKNTIILILIFSLLYVSAIEIVGIIPDSCNVLAI